MAEALVCRSSDVHMNLDSLAGQMMQQTVCVEPEVFFWASCEFEGGGPSKCHDLASQYVPVDTSRAKRAVHAPLNKWV